MFNSGRQVKLVLLVVVTAVSLSQPFQPVSAFSRNIERSLQSESSFAICLSDTSEAEFCADIKQVNDNNVLGLFPQGGIAAAWKIGVLEDDNVTDTVFSTTWELTSEAAAVLGDDKCLTFPDPVDLASNNLFGSCDVEQVSTVFLTLDGDSSEEKFSFRDSTSDFCLTVIDDAGVISEPTDASILKAEVCFDSDDCPLLDGEDESTCQARKSSQVFKVEGVADLLTQAPTPSPTPEGQGNNSPPTVLPFQPFSDRFERIYQSLILLVFFGIICLVVWKYDLVPDRVKDSMRCGRRSHERNLLEGIDLPKRTASQNLAAAASADPESQNAATSSNAIEANPAEEAKPSI